MREILFKAKRVDNGDWCYGVPIFDGWSKKTYIASYEYSSLALVQQIEVIHETLCEYTGLTDKNGKRIFEGDIVKRVFTLWHGETKKTRETQIGVVVYSNRDCSFQVEKKCNLRKPWDGDTIEVIGNIHDNPEFLTEERSE